MRLIPAGALTVFCAASLWQIIYPPKPKLIYNASASAPLGWYAVEPKRDLQRGDMVAAFAPVEARQLAADRGYLPKHVPLIKTVWATGGEQICHDGELVRVPNRTDIAVFRQDGLGRAMPVMSGCYRLDADEVFVISLDVQTSWDSRYFGPVSVEQIIGPVRYMGETPERLEGAGHGSWRGGQDKRREASFGAIPLSAHLIWEAYALCRAARQYYNTPDAMGLNGSPPEYETTRLPLASPQ